MKSTSLRPVRRGHRKCVRCGEVKPDAEIGPTYGPYMGKCLDYCEPPETSLSRNTPLRSRSLSERTKDKPDEYGELFERVREMPCFGREFLPGHECQLGYAPASAHHLHDKDSEGMVPCCGWLHDMCELRTTEVEIMLERAGSPSLEELGQLYVDRARKEA